MVGVRPTGRLPTSRRVRKRPEFQEIQAKGRRVTTPHFVLLLHAAQSPDSPPRLGVVASRRIGPSVVRNRAKRLIREAFRSTRELWQPGIDLVVIARRPPGALKLADVVEEWRGAAKPIRRRAREALKDRETRETSLAEAGQRSQTRPGTA